MFQFPGFHFDRRSALERELDHLHREVARLSRSASRYGADAYDETRRGGQEMYDGMMSAVMGMLPVARKKANAMEQVVRENPAATTALVGLVVVGLVASLLYARRSGD